MLKKISESVYRCDEPTPNGGAFSLASYKNENGPCKPEEATDVMIQEFDKDNNLIFTTFGKTKPKK